MAIITVKLLNFYITGVNVS